MASTIENLAEQIVILKGKITIAKTSHSASGDDPDILETQLTKLQIQYDALHNTTSESLLVQKPTFGPGTNTYITTPTGRVLNTTSGEADYDTAVASHDAAVTAQENASKAQKGIFGTNLFSSPATLFYGFTEDEWSIKTDLEKKGIRNWAHEQAGQYITVPEADVWTQYISTGDGSAMDGFYGPKYKYSSFFQNTQNFLNRDQFQAAETERNAVNGTRGFITPSNASSLKELDNRFVQRASNSYSGCDITPSITVGGKTFVIGNLSAISYSVHRDKVPVRTLGRTYAKSYVSGGATIAGTLVFTVFDTHVLDEVRREVVSEVQAAGGQSSPLTQQLPPFDVTIFFQNEYGHASYMRIYGIEITDEAQTHTINDVFSENQMQYIARDIDLMTRAGDTMFSPQALAGSNGMMFSKYNMATPSYRLQQIKDNSTQIGTEQEALARLNNQVTVLKTKISELQKSTVSAENTNQIAALTIQLNSFIAQTIAKNTKIKSLQNDNIKLTASQSEVDDASVNLGSNTSASRDDPYAISRGAPLKANPAPQPVSTVQASL